MPVCQDTWLAEAGVITHRKDSPVLAELEAKGAIKITGAMYNLETGALEFFG
jgi:carbonic anhydrase